MLKDKIKTGQYAIIYIVVNYSFYGVNGIFDNDMNFQKEGNLFCPINKDYLYEIYDFLLGSDQFICFSKENELINLFHDREKEFPPENEVSYNLYLQDALSDDKRSLQTVCQEMEIDTSVITENTLSLIISTALKRENDELPVLPFNDAKIFFIDKWADFHGHSRWYVTTSYGTVYYDNVKKEWEEKDSDKKTFLYISKKWLEDKILHYLNLDTIEKLPTVYQKKVEYDSDTEAETILREWLQKNKQAEILQVFRKKKKGMDYLSIYYQNKRRMPTI